MPRTNQIEVSLSSLDKPWRHAGRQPKKQICNQKRGRARTANPATLIFLPLPQPPPRSHLQAHLSIIGFSLLLIRLFYTAHVQPPSPSPLRTSTSGPHIYTHASNNGETRQTHPHLHFPPSTSKWSAAKPLLFPRTPPSGSSLTPYSSIGYLLNRPRSISDHHMLLCIRTTHPK